jgi:hypothetical protein
MKSTPRRRRPQAQPPQQQAAASFGGSGGMPMNAFVVHPGKTKYGPRNWGKLEYAQAAIGALYPVIPASANHSQLVDKVNDHLKRDPGYSFGKISRQTVMRALKELRKANR